MPEDESQVGSVRSRRKRPRWVKWGALVMAAFAALALTVAVLLARRALHQASEVIARGEANTIVSRVQLDLSGGGELSAKALEDARARYGSRGLRYVAVYWGSALHAEAGVAELPQPQIKPGDFMVRAGRVRLVDWVAPRNEALPPLDPDALPDAGRPPEIPPILVVELETPVAADLQADMRRMVIVSGGAVMALVAFAVAWLRTARKMDEIQERAERERRMVALGQMSSVLAHELRNPLASLKGHAQLLAEDLEEQKDPRLPKVERVVREAERIERLAVSLLELVRDGPLASQSVPTSQLVTRIVEDCREPKRVTTHLEHAPSTLMIDEDRLARAIRNLVDNALALSEGDVELSITQRDGDVTIDVSDTGPGLPADVERLFEPFVTTRTQGTGLGLPLARRIVEQHGGTLRAENRSVRGACFRATLPRTLSR